jgi:hypothetical protein
VVASLRRGGGGGFVGTLVRWIRGRLRARRRFLARRLKLAVEYDRGEREGPEARE